MPLETKYEEDFANEVVQFLKDNNVTMYVFSRRVTTNIEKLEDFVNNRQGTLSSKVIGRMKNFMKSYKSN